MTAPAAATDLDRRPGLAVRCQGLTVTYLRDGTQITALREANLVIADSESVAVLGPSGSGKSTLLTTLAGLQAPTSGLVEVVSTRLDRSQGRHPAQTLALDIGILLQNPARNLLALATARENLHLVLEAAGGSRAAHRERASELLQAVGLADAGSLRVSALSGGEQQRLALAVALANRPRLLLADEPTSQLDRATGRRIALLLQEAHRRDGTALLVVTHDPDVAALMDRTVEIRDGRLTPRRSA